MERTVTELERILTEERKTALKEGKFGLDECKKVIKWSANVNHKTLHELYCEYVVRGLSEACFNTWMIVACEHLMKEESEKLKTSFGRKD